MDRVGLIRCSLSTRGVGPFVFSPRWLCCFLAALSKWLLPFRNDAAQCCPIWAWDMGSDVTQRPIAPPFNVEHKWGRPFFDPVSLLRVPSFALAPLLIALSILFLLYPFGDPSTGGFILLYGALDAPQCNAAPIIAKTLHTLV